MNRHLVALALCIFAGHAAAITATVAPASQQSPSAPGATAGGGTGADTANATTAAPTAQSVGATSSNKASTPSAASATKPAAVLSAPDVPTKAATVSTSKSAGVRDKAVIVPPTKVAPAPTAASKAWAATAVGGATMRRGTLETLNVSASTLQVYGQKLTFNPQRVKVFDRNGRPASIYTLKGGAKVRYTIDPADPAQRRVAVIYVD